MLRVFFLFTAVVIASRAIAAEPIYLTSSARLEPYGLADSLTFVAPYFTNVSTTLAVSITKASSSNSSSTGSQSQDKQTSPTITHAEWAPVKDAAGQTTAGLVTLKVTCNLTTVLTANANSLTIEASKNPDYNGTFLVKTLDANSVTLLRPGTKDVTAYHGGGMITDTFCPAQSSGAGGDTAYSIVFNTVTVPKDRGYLYLARNAFFADSINVSVDSNGMLSSSDSSSQQQVTAILTELAQTAAAFSKGPLFVEERLPSPPPPHQDARKACYSAISELLKTGPFFKIRAISAREMARHSFAWPVAIPGTNPPVTITFMLDHAAVPAEFEGYDKIEVEANGRRQPIYHHSGLVAFLPVPARASIRCDAGGSSAYLAPPTTINLYAQRQFVDPQRDLLTGPQDTFTFSGGIITAHKYTDQSPARTVVDTITAPIRAIMPSTSVQQTTSVQSTAGKPDQVTQSTQTTTGPPKSP